MERYAEWQASAMAETRKKVLMTISSINEDAGKELTETELEKLNYCWDIIRDMTKIECLEHQMKSKLSAYAGIEAGLWSISEQIEASGQHAEHDHAAGNSGGNGNAAGNGNGATPAPQ